MVTVGVAVGPETFVRVRAANAEPALAEVPIEQDAKEFELHFANAVSLDVLTPGDAVGHGAIARYLEKYGEGIQQVEFLCRNVDRAAEILKERFATASVYPKARAGAANTKINFFLLPVPDSTSQNSKILIELYELPSEP